MLRAISNLREQLLSVKAGAPMNGISAEHFGLLISIIDKLEILEEAQTFEDSRLVEAASEWYVQARQAYDVKSKKLTAAEVEIERLRTGRNYWKKRCLEAERLVSALHENRQSGLAEAKATLKREREEGEIVFEMVQEQRNEATDKLEKLETAIERLRIERDSAEQKLKALKAIDARILADAALGRLVRGMRGATRLAKGSVFFWAEERRNGKDWRRVGKEQLNSNPTKALRNIQEKKQ